MSASGVRKVWERNGLVKKLSRYLWLEREVSEGRGIMTKTPSGVVRRLKRLQEASDQHVDANQPGELLSQDLYFVGVIKGVVAKLPAGQLCDLLPMRYIESFSSPGSAIKYLKLLAGELGFEPR